MVTPETTSSGSTTRSSAPDRSEVNRCSSSSSKRSAHHLRVVFVPRPGDGDEMRNCFAAGLGVSACRLPLFGRAYCIGPFVRRRSGLLDRMRLLAFWRSPANAAAFLACCRRDAGLKISRLSGGGSSLRVGLTYNPHLPSVTTAVVKTSPIDSGTSIPPLYFSTGSLVDKSCGKMLQSRCALRISDRCPFPAVISAGFTPAAIFFVSSL